VLSRTHNHRLYVETFVYINLKEFLFLMKWNVLLPLYLFQKIERTRFVDAVVGAKITLDECRLDCEIVNENGCS